MFSFNAILMSSVELLNRFVPRNNKFSHNNNFVAFLIFNLNAE